MDVSILWAQESPIAVHAVLGLAAIMLGAVQLALPRGTALHRRLGAAWVMLLGGVAVTGLFIHEIRLLGLFSPIHLLSVIVLASLWQAIAAVRRGDIRRHRTIMASLYVFALVITGAVTLLPGRVMHQVVFGQ